MKEEYTGSTTGYFTVEVKNPAQLLSPYAVECIDVIEALQMSFAEGEAFKALWRLCARKVLKTGKKGGNTFYDAEKIMFYSKRILVRESSRHDNDSHQDPRHPDHQN